MVEIKGAIEVTIELWLKIRMMVHLLGHKSVKKDSTKR